MNSWSEPETLASEALASDTKIEITTNTPSYYNLS
jgi:hypothetical protein